MSNTEIERKFLVREPPADLSTFSVVRIAQGYLAVEQDGTEVRIRETVDRDDNREHTQTVKSAGSLVRGELGISLTHSQFETLWPATLGRRVEKDRFTIPYGEHTIELDEYLGRLGGLIVAEVEFDSIDAANGFQPPEWFGEDVTAIAGLKNQQLAMHGIPEGIPLHNVGD